MPASDIGLPPTSTDPEDLLAIYGRVEFPLASDFSFDVSVGYQLRATHRAMQRHLSLLIEPHGVTLGMWYFLRALWQQDGVTQSDLSRKIGTMEPTTLNAISSMEKNGLVRRVRDKVDRRRQLVYLTARGRSLKTKLMPLAVQAVQKATHGLPVWEVALLLELLKKLQVNLDDASSST